MSSSPQLQQGRTLARKTWLFTVRAFAAWGVFCLVVLILALAGAHHLAHTVFQH